MKVVTIQDSAILSNEVKMPWLGLGVFRASEGGEVEQAIRWALECGYRSIDTAAVYQNESGVGEAVRRSQIPRTELFITTKLWNNDHGYDKTLRAFDRSLGRLGMDYVDLYLIHWPVPGKFLDTWRALERIYTEKRARAIGVSNFLTNHLEALMADSQVTPMVNQIEFHPYLLQSDLLDFCRRSRIQVEAWSPLMKGRLVSNAALEQIGRTYGKSAAQIILRWDLQHGVVAIPKSVHKDRITSNADIFGFELTGEDMAAIDAMDRGERVGPDPNNFTF